MNDDRRELIVRLCTAAGILMEDLSASAVMLPTEDDPAIRAAVHRLARASKEIEAIVSAAAALARPSAD